MARLRHMGRGLDSLGGMPKSRSIRHPAAERGFAGATSFRWHHRFLTVSNRDRVRYLAGIDEAIFTLDANSALLDQGPGVNVKIASQSHEPATVN